MKEKKNNTDLEYYRKNLKDSTITGVETNDSNFDGLSTVERMLLTKMSAVTAWVYWWYILLSSFRKCLEPRNL